MQQRVKSSPRLSVLGIAPSSTEVLEFLSATGRTPSRTACRSISSVVTTQRKMVHTLSDSTSSTLPNTSHRPMFPRNLASMAGLSSQVLTPNRCILTPQSPLLTALFPRVPPSIPGLNFVRYCLSFRNELSTFLYFDQLSSTTGAFFVCSGCESMISVYDPTSHTNGARVPFVYWRFFRQSTFATGLGRSTSLVPVGSGNVRVDPRPNAKYTGLKSPRENLESGGARSFSGCPTCKSIGRQTLMKVDVSLC